MAGLPHGGRTIAPELHVAPEKLFQLKETFIGTKSSFIQYCEEIFRLTKAIGDHDHDAEEFMAVYGEVLRMFKSELERMDQMSDEFCSSYLEALKPGS